MDAMSRSLCHIVATEDAGSRLDALCAARGLYASRSAAARAIEEGRVFVNGATVSKKHAVAAGDTIVYEVDDEPESVVVYGEPIDLDIRFEDEDMLVLSKQIGLVCHPSVDHAHGTLVNALIWHCGEENLCNVQGEEADRLGIVHRLDRDTSGSHAGGQDRRGRARAHGPNSRSRRRPPLHRARSRHHGPRHRHDRRAHRALRRRARAAWPCATCRAPGRPSRRFACSSASRPAPRTTATASSSASFSPGRTHQIRVHMQYTRHPIVGDPVYNAHGPRDARAQLGLRRQFLHSYSIAFEHPTTGEPMAFADNLPRDLQEALDSLVDREPRQNRGGARGGRAHGNVARPFCGRRGTR